MTKPIAITADSPIDLSKELLERYQISVIPMLINLGEKTYRDGIDITTADMYHHYAQYKELPKTSAIPILDYDDFFHSFTDKGMEVIHFSLSSAISSTHQNALVAASEMEGVYVVDSLALSTAIALLAIKACEMRDAGLPAAEIAEKINAMRQKSHVSFVLDTLEFMRKGGRCSAVAALGANILGIKPSIVMEDGSLHLGKKYRGKLLSVHEQYIKDTLSAYSDVDYDRIFIEHSGIPKAHEDALYQLIKENYNFKEVLIANAGCTIAAHCGEGTMGILFMSK